VVRIRSWTDGDAHATTGQMAVIANDPALLLKRLRKLGRVKCCCEAGPTGFGLQRALTTHRLDAVRLARFLSSGDLTDVYVPDRATEAMRDLERTRDDAKKAERVARHQLCKFLLRHGRRYVGKTAWRMKHPERIRAQHFDQEAQQRVLEDYLRAVEDQGERVESLTRAIVGARRDVEPAAAGGGAPGTARDQHRRGHRAGGRARRPRALRERTKADALPGAGAVRALQPRGSPAAEHHITRAGNGHARSILAEAVWAHRYRPTTEPGLRVAQRGGVARGAADRMAGT
jgi:transposase